MNKHSLAHQDVVPSHVAHDRGGDVPRLNIHLPTQDDLALRAVNEALDPRGVRAGDNACQ